MAIEYFEDGLYVSLSNITEEDIEDLAEIAEEEASEDPEFAEEIEHMCDVIDVMCACLDMSIDAGEHLAHYGTSAGARLRWERNGKKHGDSSFDKRFANRRNAVESHIYSRAQDAALRLIRTPEGKAAYNSNKWFGASRYSKKQGTYSYTNRNRETHRKNATSDALGRSRKGFGKVRQPRFRDRVRTTLNNVRKRSGFVTSNLRSAAVRLVDKITGRRKGKRNR